MYASHGVILDVDLEKRTVARIEVDPADVRKYAGGSGLACALMMRDKDPATVDPMGPDNDLWFLVGTMVGTGAPVTPKLLVCARSPLTGIWGEAAGGGFFPAQLKLTGVDGFVLRGVASSPVYLVVTEDGLTIEDADDLWGMDTFEVHDALLERHGSKGRAAAIGPAGELGVKFASIMLDGLEARAVGRCGMGTVMGVKNVKAVYARGKAKVPLFDGKGLKQSVKDSRKKLLASTKGLTDWSTAGGVEAVEFHGDLPVKNWQLGAWKEGAQRLGAQAWMPKHLLHHGTCSQCPVRCHKRVGIEDGPYASPEVHGPEYETLAGFGSNLLIDDPLAVVKANEIANRLGYDTISGASVMGFAWEAFEKGALSLEDTGGLVLEWGDGGALVAMATLIGMRQTRAGEMLGEGARAAARELGGEAAKWTIEVKGLEMPYHDPRAHVSMAPNYATAVRGGCHLDSLSYFVGRGVPAPDLGYTEPFTDHDSTPEMAKLCYVTQNYQSMFNPLGLCKFLFVGQVGPRLLAEWISLATGFDVDADEYMETGERILQLKRLYNVRVGVTKDDDTLPYRLLHEPQPDGKAGGVVPDLPVMLDELYRLRGWDDQGAPTAETVARFGLEEFVFDG
jgi:aldehyde:ferredoxin oxidoreductase